MVLKLNGYVYWKKIVRSPGDKESKLKKRKIKLEYKESVTSDEME
jgi:hypothetical protein